LSTLAEERGKNVIGLPVIKYDDKENQSYPP